MAYDQSQHDWLRRLDEFARHVPSQPDCVLMPQWKIDLLTPEEVETIEQHFGVPVKPYDQ